MNREQKILRRLDQALARLPEHQREGAIENLKVLERLGAIEPGFLIQLLKDNSAPLRVRSLAAWLAGFIQEDSMVESLEEVLQPGVPTELAWEAAKALCSLESGHTAFRKLLRRNERDLLKIAIFSSGCLRDRKSVADLCRILKTDSASAEIRGHAAEALGYIKDHSSFEALCAAAMEPAVEVRYWAVFALGQLGDIRAKPLLKQLAANDEGRLENGATVAEEATTALKDLGRWQP